MNMKKFFAVLMMLCLLMGVVSAQASSSGEMYYITYCVNDNPVYPGYEENTYVSFSPNKIEVSPGELVTVTPKDGYQITDMRYYFPDDMNAIVCQQNGSAWSFTMPDSGIDVMITVEGGSSGGNSNPPPAQPSTEITFDPNSGSCTVPSATVNSQNKLTTLPTATKNGHIFVGWFLDSGEKVTLDTVFSENTTVKAHWVSVVHDTTKEADNAYSSIITLNDQGLLERLLKEDDLNQDENIRVWMEVEETQEDKLPHDEMNAISVKAEGDKIAAYLDISLYKQVGNKQAEKIPNTNGPIPIVMHLTDDVIPENAGADSFYIIYYHEGVADTLDASYKPSTKTLSFKAEKFSTYALVHKTHTPSQNIPAPQTSAPKTGDDSNVLLWFALACVSLIGITLMIRKKKEA